MTIDLWPTEINAADELFPVTLVMEQAELLHNHTANLVKAEVRPIASTNGRFAFDFELVAKTLEYRFSLFRLDYGVERYPAALIPHSKIAQELGLSNVVHRQMFVPAAIANDKDELLKVFGSILRSETTKNILQTLIAQSRKFKR